MDKETIIKLAVIGGSVALSVLGALRIPQTVSLFGTSLGTPTPTLKLPDSAEVAKEKTAAIAELIKSDAFNSALPSAQKKMLEAIKDIYN